MAVAGHRQRELKDPELRDELASARAVLKRYSGMMMTASKAYIRHPELAASKANRDFVLQEVIKVI
jgi:catenin alpha